MPRKHDWYWATRFLRRDSDSLQAAKDTSDAYKLLHDQAKRVGATLATGGRGSLAPNLVLEVYLRDNFQCSITGCTTPRDNLDLDHIGGHPAEIAADPEATLWLKRMAANPAAADSPEGLHVLCKRHHDMVHNRERVIEGGGQPPEIRK